MTELANNSGSIPEDAECTLGDDVTEVFAAPAGERHTIIRLDLDLPDELIERLDALTESTGQSYEEIAQAALVAYAPLASSSATMRQARTHTKSKEARR